MAQSLGKERIFNMFNEIFRMSGAHDLKLEVDEADEQQRDVEYRKRAVYHSTEGAMATSYRSTSDDYAENATSRTTTASTTRRTTYGGRATTTNIT